MLISAIFFDEKMKPQKHQEAQQTSFDKADNVNPFTKYMITKGMKQHYIPHIFMVEPNTQHNTNDQQPLGDDDLKRL